ncbi:MAG: HYR domain-containing protein [Acidobacteria bacterium]|nr:HYR domain-containing protein [Acidobacteriota bacterium]
MTRPMRRGRVLVFVVLAAACGRSSSPTGPTPPPVPPPVAPVTLACRPPMAVTAMDDGVSVTWEVPAAEGGEVPVAVACAPAPGSVFPLGTTEVRCTATDRGGRTASCTFPVTVSRAPTLSKTRFLAFGDSVTVGIVATINPAGPPPYLLREVPEAAYPRVLQQLLAARYPSQAITVLNEGKGGEKVVDGVGRAQSVINANRPEAVLVLDGYNDLGLGEAGIDPAIAAITSIAKDARFRGARVFIATLTPPPVGVNRGLSNTTVTRYNAKLRDVARGENAVLVDVYEACAGNPNACNSDDGRHPSEAGYRRIAETFFAAIQRELEGR